MNIVKTAIAAAALAMIGGAASAATCQFGEAADYTQYADVWTSTACEGAIAGNDSAAAANSYGGTGLFGINTWEQDSKWDADTNTYSPDGVLNITTYAGGQTGSWSVDSWDGILNAVLVVKGSTQWAAYLIDMTAGTMGEWSTFALLNGGGKIPSISHISLYVNPAPAPVPLPAAGLMLVGGLGALAAVRRRKQQA